MATEKRAPDSSDPQQAPAPTAGGPPPLWTTPIVLQRSKGRKKRKKKYSRGTKGFQRLFLGFGSAGQRIATGFSRGAKNWVRRSKRSRRKKRDGIVRDAFSNVSRGIRKSSNDISKAPNEITKRFNTRRGWRMVRVFNPF